MRWTITTFDNSALRQEGHDVYTVGIGRMKKEDVHKLLSRLQVEHVFDVRGATQQRVPLDFKPSNMTDLVSKWGVMYHDETKTLGFRPNYQLYALSDEFAHSMQPLAEIAKQSNILIACAETDYRKCHRKLVASFLSRRGLRVHHLVKGLPINFQSTLETSMIERPLARRMFTIGFTKKSMREFATLLRDARIKRVVDIRLRPVSQYSGFARKEDLEFLLELMGIEYVYSQELAPTPQMLDGYWSNNDWTRYEHAFRKLIDDRKPDDLLKQLLTPGVNVAFLCSEDTPEHCHRRLVSEYAKRIFRDLEIVHLTSKGTFQSGTLDGDSNVRLRSGGHP